MRGSTNKSPTKLTATEKQIWRGNLFMNGENLQGKNPTRWI